MVAQTADEAMDNANDYGSCDKGMCLWTVQEWCESPHVYPSAWEQWCNASKPHPGDRNPPAGAPVFYKGGQYGHVALSMGGGKIRSTDCTSTYDVSTVDLAWCESHWGYPYAGWTEDIGNVDLPYLEGGSAGGGGEKGLFGMSKLDKFSRTKDKSYTDNGSWQTVHIDDDDSLSFLTGPNDGYMVTAGITVSDLAAGEVAQFRYQAVSDYPDNRDTVTEYSYPIVELIGTSGSTYGVVSWFNDLGKSPKSDAKLRLRLFVKPPAGKKINIAGMASRVMYS